MTSSNLKTSPFIYLFLFSGITVFFGLLSFTNHPIPEDLNANHFIDCAIDSLENPVIQTDTIITFDPKTGEETVAIVRRTQPAKVYPAITQNIPARNTGIDTIIIFDAETFEETWIVVDNETGVRDTIR